MRTKFHKIRPEDFDETRVTITLLNGDDGAVLARVSTLALNEYGAVELMTLEGEPPIDVAIALAAEVADFKEQDIDVLDPLGLWRPSLGELADT